MSVKVSRVPAAYAWRRIHSLFGLWFTLFLTEHLITNSQSALLFGSDGIGFVRAVNWIHQLPYRVVIELVLLGVPIAFHAAWGIYYMISSKPNSLPSDGSKPALTKYPRNHAYTWQRITAWILLIGVVAHVTSMRFIDYPAEAQLGKQKYYFTNLSLDPGLYTVAKRLHVTLYSERMVQKQVTQYLREKDSFRHEQSEANQTYEELSEEYDDAGSIPYSHDANNLLDAAQKDRQIAGWISALTAKPLAEGEVVAVADNFGTATLLLVRNTFKSIWVSAFYTIFVLCAAFHGFNGLWTFFITWGTILRIRSQKVMAKVCTALIVAIAFLGLISIWGTYWINLRY